LLTLKKDNRTNKQARKTTKKTTGVLSFSEYLFPQVIFKWLGIEGVLYEGTPLVRFFLPFFILEMKL
jgi:hypothetical protein